MTVRACSSAPGNRDLNEETFWRVARRSEVALRHGASVERDTASDAEAGAPFRGRWRVARPESWDELPWSSGPSLEPYPDPRTVRSACSPAL